LLDQLRIKHFGKVLGNKCEFLGWIKTCHCKQDVWAQRSNIGVVLEGWAQRSDIGDLFEGGAR
jgi:hypothetical protein